MRPELTRPAWFVMILAVLPASAAPAQDCPIPFEFDEGTFLSDYGKVVASAGDINGDGFDDIIVGAPEDDAGFLDRPGRAFVYFGGPGADAVPDLTLTGDKNTQWFGISVGGIGDYNDDGFDDFIVGAPGGLYAQPLDYPGDAYIFFGGADPDATPDIHLVGENDGDSFGDVVAGIGDYNNDGFPDVAVGAPFFDNPPGPGTEAGKVYVYFGGPGADTVADRSLAGTGPADYLGDKICAAGDMNGDGIDDFAVSARGFGSLRGQAYLFLGRSDPVLQASVVYTGSANLDQLGATIAGVGDINEDGFDDLALRAAPDKVHLYFGGFLLPDNTVDRVYLGTTDERYGGAIGAADVNDDGHPDLLIGKEHHEIDQLQVGRVNVFLGGPLLDLFVDFQLDGEVSNGGNFGAAVSNAGDFDGDGRDDVIVGAPSNPVSFPVGKVYVYPGTLFVDCDGNDVPDQCDFANGSAADCNGNGIPDGCDIANAVSNDCNVNGIPDECEPDCNGNGIPDSCDLASGFSRDCDATGIPDECEAVGGGDCNANGVPDICDLGMVLRAEGSEFQSEFGHDVATGGDFDGDGLEDLLVGAASEHAHTGPGRAYLFGGGPGLDATADFVFAGENAGDEFGASLDFAGDFNGDGFDDLIVGAPGNDAGPSDGGRVYLYFGGPGADTNADHTIAYTSGGGFGARLGQVVVGAGDVNGDGFDDVLVGAPGLGQSARVFLYLGGDQYSPGSQLSAAQSIGDLGQSWVYPAALAGGGDLNGDSFADVLLGTYAASGGPGRTEVLLGGPGGLSELTTLNGAGPDDRFGFSVDFAGDQNGDGIDDVLIGAPFDSFSGFRAGRAYLFLGGAGMDPVADLEYLPPPAISADGYFGISVDGGRDLDGDGLSDLVIGQSAQRNGGSAGRAYVFFGPAVDDVVLDRLVVGEFPGAELGRDVALAGDLDGDGLADFVLGAPGANLLGRVDAYDTRAESFVDCNENEIGDACDIESGLAADTNANGIPDGCEATAVRPGSPQVRLRLNSAVPNPFNPTTVLAFDLPSDGRATIDIYDTGGRRVRTLLDENMVAGTHRVRWNGDDATGRRVASGVYFARLNLEAGTVQHSPSLKKLLLLK